MNAMLEKLTIEPAKNVLRRLKWGPMLTSLVGAHGVSAVSTSIPHGERTLEYPWVLKTLGSLSCKRILDVGCGPVSIMPLWLCNLGYEVWGCDLRHSKRSVPGFRFVQCDVARTNELPQQYFDAVTCVSTIEHVGLGRYDGDVCQEGADVTFLRSFGRFLNSEGKIILTFPFGVPGLCANLARIDAYRVRDERQTRTLANLAGFEIESMECFRLEGGYWHCCEAGQAGAVDSREEVNALCGVVLRQMQTGNPPIHEPF